MTLKLLPSQEAGPSTVVTFLIHPPTEERDGVPTEVVSITDRHHRTARELMKHLGYRWVGGNFNGEIWFRPKDPKMFANGPRHVTVTYKTTIEEVKDMDRSDPDYEVLFGVPEQPALTEGVEENAPEV